MQTNREKVGPGSQGWDNDGMILWESRELEGRGGDFFHACHIQMVFTNMSKF